MTAKHAIVMSVLIVGSAIVPRWKAPHLIFTVSLALDVAHPLTVIGLAITLVPTSHTGGIQMLRSLDLLMKELLTRQDWSSV